MTPPAASSAPPPAEDEGPVTPETLGRATWTFLHTLAAAYPPAPTPAEASRMARFLTDFAALYPCAPCAASFRAILRRSPPDTRGGGALPAWLCAAHNEVNAELGKAPFDCAAVGQRWGVCEGCAAAAPALAAFRDAAGGCCVAVTPRTAADPGGDAVEVRGATGAGRSMAGWG